MAIALPRRDTPPYTQFLITHFALWLALVNVAGFTACHFGCGSQTHGYLLDLQPPPSIHSMLAFFVFLSELLKSLSR